MSVISRMRRQKAVWWAKTGTNEFGEPSFASPVEVKCRWDDSGTEYRNQQGQTFVSDATVYPDRLMSAGDKLMKGEIDSNTPDSPSDLLTAFEIKRFDTTPNFRATENLYTAYL